MTTQRHVVAAVLAALALSVLSSLAVGTDSPIDAPVPMPKQPASATLTQAQYQSLESKAPCFHRVIASLDSDCPDLSVDAKRRLALALARCHIAASGRPLAPCHPNATVKQCTSVMSSEAFVVYTEFTTHVDSICFFLRSDLWRATTAAVVDSLQGAARTTTDRLQAHIVSQSELLKNQELSLRHERELLLSEQALLQGMEAADLKLSQYLSASYQASVQTSMEGVGEQLRQESASVLDMLGKLQMYTQAILDLHGLLTADLEVFQIVGFYMLATGLGWMFTSLRRTSQARLAVLALIWCGAVMEWLFVSHSWSGVSDYIPLFERDGVRGATSLHQLQHVVRQHAWMLRKILLAVCIAVTARYAWRFKDIGHENHVMLKRLLHLVDGQAGGQEADKCGPGLELLPCCHGRSDRADGDQCVGYNLRPRPCRQPSVVHPWCWDSDDDTSSDFGSDESDGDLLSDASTCFPDDCSDLGDCKSSGGDVSD